MGETRNLTVTETARWLGVDPKTVYRLAKRGQLPGFKAGSQWRFNQQMLEEWVAEQVTMEWLKVEDRARDGERSSRNGGP